MKVNVYLSGSNPVHDRVLTAFYNGVPVNSDLTAELRDVHKPAPCDVAVVFGIRKERVPLSYPRGEIIRRQRDENRPVVVLETGYVKRGDGLDDYYAAGLNGLNGRAEFRNSLCRDDRWQQLGIPLQPWSGGGQHIVLCGQVPWDASVQHHDHLGWIRQSVSKLGSLTHREIRFRPHPLARSLSYGQLPGATISHEFLDDDIRNAHCVVTFNSNAGVDAAIAGVPVFVLDPGSMAWPVAQTALTQIEHPIRPPREQWAANLAYTQWTLHEMAQGLAWQHLFP